MRSTMVILASALAAATVAALAAPPAQAAVPNLVVRSAAVAGGEGTVACQPGEVALGGGSSVADPTNAYVARDQPEPPAGTPTGWHAWVRHRADGSPATATVSAVCASGVVATVRSAYFDQGGDGAVACQPGEVASGGGIGADLVTNTYVARSHPEPASGSPTSWRGWLRNRPDGGLGTGTVYAVCAQGLALTVRSASFAGGEGTVACAPGEVATGGGVGAGIPESAYLARSQPEPGAGSPSGWRGSVRARSDGAPASGTVHAVCARETDAPETQITVGPAEGETVGDVPPAFEFTASEPGSRFECRTFDPAQPDPAAQAFQPCTSPHTRTDLVAEIALGERSTFEVRASDAAGNVDETPASRTYVKHGKLGKPPIISKCEPVAIDAAHGNLVEANCRLTAIRNGKVMCVNAKTLKNARCEFKRRRGSWIRSTKGENWAVVGQSISRQGKRKGKFVVAAPVGKKRSSPCAGDPPGGSRAARDAAGKVAGTELQEVCVIETANASWNATGLPLVNYATREVCTSSYPHPDGAQLVSTPSPGVYCYTGYGAGLNDTWGIERAADGRYLREPEYCHVLLNGYGAEIAAAKRPNHRSFPTPDVKPTTPITWRAVVDYVRIAN